MDEAERGEFERLVKTLMVVDEWMTRVSVDGPRPQVAPGSPLAGDDRRTAPYHMSWGVWHSLSHAVDHLHCLRTVIREGATLHIYAPYTLVRGALENAAAAMWMVQPTSRDERVARRLRLAAVDLRAGSAVAETMGMPMPRTRDERLDDLRVIARRDGLNESDIVRGVRYEEIMTAIGEPGGSSSKAPVVAWRACSAIAHGDLWATINVTAREEIDSTAAGLVHNRVSANVAGLHSLVALTAAIAKAAWALYERRGTPPFA